MCSRPRLPTFAEPMTRGPMLQTTPTTPALHFCKIFFLASLADRDRRRREVASSAAVINAMMLPHINTHFKFSRFLIYSV